MKLLYILAACVVAVSASLPFDGNETRVNGENGWYIPREDGSLYWVDMDEAESTMEALENIEEYSRLTTTPVTYYLYTKENPNKSKKIIATTKSIAASNFNAANPTRFIIHGWFQSYLSFINKDIRRAWLSKGDFNIIFVDWARGRSVDYASSVLAVPRVGKKVASMIDFLLNTTGMSLGTLEVVGHSLGAHVAGYAGKNVKTGQIQTIVGLDPALPLYNYKNPCKRLASTDAYYVESIHTNGGTLGFLKPIGKGSFYPNGGKSQPSCLFTDVICDHARSITYYAEAVANDNFATMNCTTYKHAVANNCGSTYSSIRMGADTNAYIVAGNYFVPVNKKAPYGVLV